jgi:UDP-N-acetylglucosamine--N-acetylmuramyl-(pentapeptide) pyrophosphoryl-undecaprenol N-acetylglucosamine transferase
VTNNHQEKNARMMADKGAAVLLLEKDCTSQRLYDEICGLLSAEERRQTLAQNLRQTVRLDATERICAIVEELCKN